MKTGAVIVAAGTSSYMTDFKPMLKMGRTTLIKRIISTLKQAGADPILVVTGSNADQLEKHISRMGVICLRNERYTETQMFESARIGLEYLHDKCDRILLHPLIYLCSLCRAYISCLILLQKFHVLSIKVFGVIHY